MTTPDRDLMPDEIWVTGTDDTASWHTPDTGKGVRFIRADLVPDAEWQPPETAPKDGTECIFWVSSDKGFPDMTANFYYAPDTELNRKIGIKEGWYWSSSEEPLMRPDLVKGWKIYPQPPVVEVK
jgi:hypothetical protein